MPATEPQAILTPITEAAIFLTVTVEPGAQDGIRALLADVSARRRSVGFRIPEGQAARASVLIGDEDSAFAGGSYFVVQKYLHDLRGRNALTVEDQERAMGRTKLGDVELADEVRPADSHVALNTIVDEDGAQRQIMRFNTPFGRVGAGEPGTYFIGCVRTPAVIEQMLAGAARGLLRLRGARGRRSSRAGQRLARDREPAGGLAVTRGHDATARTG